MPGARRAKSARLQALDLGRVLRVDRADLRLGDLHLEIEDAAGPRRRVGDADQVQQVGDIGAIGGADADHVRRVGEVIIAVGHAEAALQQIGHGRVRRFQPLGDEQAEQILGEEIGRVERIDVGAQARAQTRRRGRGGSAIALIRARIGCSGAVPRASIPA